MAQAPSFVRISDLARESEVPPATIKHYVREGLIPPAAVRKSRNMAYYDLQLVPRIRAIKELQRTRFLPLRVIREIIDERTEPGLADSSLAIARTLASLAPAETRTRRELIDSGVLERELDQMVDWGVVTPDGEGDDATFTGDDLSLFRTLGAARRAGLTEEMLPHAILAKYADAISRLVRVELEMFREGVLPHAGGDVDALSEAATRLSEQLVLLLRRKMLLPTLGSLIEEANEARKPARTRARAQTKPSPQKRRGTRA